MPRPSRRDELLRAATAQFAERGVAATRVRDVAAAAGMSDAALYRHFPSLDALADELFALRMGTLGRDLAAAADGPGPLRERFAAVVAVVLDGRRDDPDAFAFVLDEQPRRMHRLPRDFPYPLHVFERLVRDGQRTGTVRPAEPRLLAAMALGALVRPGIVARHAGPGRAPDLDGPEARATLTSGAWAVLAADG